MFINAFKIRKKKKLRFYLLFLDISNFECWLNDLTWAKIFIHALKSYYLLHVEDLGTGDRVINKPNKVSDLLELTI